MADAKADPRKYPIRIEGDYAADSLFLIAARIEEGMSFLTRAEIEFVSTNRAIELRKLVGSKVRIAMDLPDGGQRLFPGTCVSVESLGATTGPGHYRAELRPWLWFLTRAQGSRVFQQLSVPNIIQTVLSEFGFSGDLSVRLTGSYPEREYVVQYRESPLAFIERLMEQEGIYYFFVEEGGKEKMVLADSPSAHQPIPGAVEVPYRAFAGSERRGIEYVSELTSAEAVTSGKVTLNDYDFERPKADLFTSTAIPKGSHGNKDHEIYEYPGHYRDPADGKRRARVRMEAEAARHRTISASGNVMRLGTGQVFELVEHPRQSDNGGYVVTHAVHSLRLPATTTPPLGITPASAEGAGFGEGAEYHHVLFEAIPKDEQYRAPLRAPWPEVIGVHTAVVVGPAGEEIYPDKYGRVKVQFHWDRTGQRDEKSSCWVRTMMPWTGKNWGMIALPRIGQEVVVQFEEGNPDRPLIVGMLYNADTMPPYTLPDDMMKSGLVTRSTTGGDAGTFHELMFDDKKREELIRFQSERDYRQIVKNNAEITVGLEHKDKGDMSLTVHRNLSETVKTGDHSFAVETGSQKIDIKKDKTEVIEGKSTLTVTGNVTETVRQGNVTRTIEMGNETTTLKLGNYALDTSAGKISMNAMQEIELKVGANSIKINQMGITINGMMIKIEGSAMLEAKAPMSTIKGDGLLILKGGLTMIN